MPRKKRTERQRIYKRLDDLIRELLKKDYELKCVTCGKGIGWFHPQTNPYGLQVSHYISRRFASVRWDLKNVHPMCSSCNYMHNVNPAPYTDFMLKVYGKKVLNDLDKKRRNLVLNLSDLRDLEEKLKSKL